LQSLGLSAEIGTPFRPPVRPSVRTKKNPELLNEISKICYYAVKLLRVAASKVSKCLQGQKIFETKVVECGEEKSFMPSELFPEFFEFRNS
jgi:hypothetical protein